MIQIKSRDPVIGYSKLSGDSVQYNDLHWAEVNGLQFVGDRHELSAMGIPTLLPVKAGDQFYGVTIRVQWSDRVDVYLYADTKAAVLHVAKALAQRLNRTVVVDHMARVLARFDRTGKQVGEVVSLDKYYTNLTPAELSYSTFTGSMIPE